MGNLSKVSVRSLLLYIQKEARNKFQQILDDSRSLIEVRGRLNEVLIYLSNVLTVIHKNNGCKNFFFTDETSFVNPSITVHLKLLSGEWISMNLMLEKN